VKKQFEPPMNADSFVGFFIGVHRRLCFFTPSPGFCRSSQRIILAIVRIRFLTSTPLDVRLGSGTYVGISVLAGALERLGHSVHVETPTIACRSTPWTGCASIAASASSRASTSPWDSTWMATASPIPAPM